MDERGLNLDLETGIWDMTFTVIGKVTLSQSFDLSSIENI